MTPFLKSITATNFRSIKGSVTVPLDAPVVLIHGQNGTGKTSLLSAIELGLTAQVPSLARLDRDYLAHLVHKDAKESRVAATVDGLNGAFRGPPILSLDGRVFLVTRCCPGSRRTSTVSDVTWRKLASAGSWKSMRTRIRARAILR